MNNPLTILFAGQTAMAKFIDGSTVSVFVRALPQRTLLGDFLNVMEFGHATVQLCTYTKAGEGVAPTGDYPDVSVPTGYWPVPSNWADNLTDDSQIDLYELAKKVNFNRAAKLAEGQIAAKKQIGPLNQKVMMQILPLVENALNGLLKKSSASAPSAPPSAATPASSS